MCIFTCTEPSSDLKSEVELGSHSELDCLLFQVPAAGVSDSVFVTLSRAAVETASCGVRKLLRTGGVPTSLTYCSGSGRRSLRPLRVGALRRAIQRHPTPHPAPTVPSRT